MERRGVIVTVVIPKNSQAIGALTSIQALIDSSARRFHKAKKGDSATKTNKNQKKQPEGFFKKMSKILKHDPLKLIIYYNYV